MWIYPLTSPNLHNNHVEETNNRLERTVPGGISLKDTLTRGMRGTNQQRRRFNVYPQDRWRPVQQRSFISPPTSRAKQLFIFFVSRNQADVSLHSKKRHLTVHRLRYYRLIIPPVPFRHSEGSPARFLNPLQNICFTSVFSCHPSPNSSHYSQLSSLGPTPASLFHTLIVETYRKINSH